MAEARRSAAGASRAAAAPRAEPSSRHRRRHRSAAMASRSSTGGCRATSAIRSSSGVAKWTTQDNLVLNTGIVASAVRIWTKLGGSAKLRAQPNKRGGTRRRTRCRHRDRGFLEAQMSKPIRAVVRRQMMKEHRGFALHEVLVRRRKDGMIVVADLQHRPQWTIQRWLRDDRSSRGARSSNRYSPAFCRRFRVIGCCTASTTRSPIRPPASACCGTWSSSRACVTYSRLEGIGFQTDLGGMPLGRAPLGELRAEALQARPHRREAIAAYILGAPEAADRPARGAQQAPRSVAAPRLAAVRCRRTSRSRRAACSSGASTSSGP
jgi:hypothetical protein